MNIIKIEGARYRLSQIGKYAFYDCYNLTTIIFQEGIATTDYFAF